MTSRSARVAASASLSSTIPARAPLPAPHAPVAGRVVERRRQEGQGRPPREVALHQPGQGRRREEREIAVGEEHVLRAVRRLPRAERRVPRSELLPLHGDSKPLRVAAACRRGQLRARLRRRHHHGAAEAGAARRLDDECEHGAARHLVEHLGAGGAHARSASGRQHDGCPLRGGLPGAGRPRDDPGVGAQRGLLSGRGPRAGASLASAPPEPRAAVHTTSRARPERPTRPRGDRGRVQLRWLSPTMGRRAGGWLDVGADDR